jgi:hypothetical protein
MIRIVMTGMLCGAWAAPLAATNFTAAPHAQHKLDLDTAPGHYSYWDSNDLNGLNAIRARFRIKALGRDGKWEPVFRFQVKRGDEVLQMSVLGVAGRKALLPHSISESPAPRRHLKIWHHPSKSEMSSIWKLTGAQTAM